MKNIIAALFEKFSATSVDKIVADFHKTVAKLDKHANTHVDKANSKVEQATQVTVEADELIASLSAEADAKVEKLSAEISEHHNEAHRALAIKANISKLLAI